MVLVGYPPSFGAILVGLFLWMIEGILLLAILTLVGIRGKVAMPRRSPVLWATPELPPGSRCPEAGSSRPSVYMVV